MAIEPNLYKRLGLENFAPCSEIESKVAQLKSLLNTSLRLVNPAHPISDLSAERAALQEVEDILLSAPSPIRDSMRGCERNLMLIKVRVVQHLAFTTKEEFSRYAHVLQSDSKIAAHVGYLRSRYNQLRQASMQPNLLAHAASQLNLNTFAGSWSIQSPQESIPTHTSALWQTVYEFNQRREISEIHRYEILRRFFGQYDVNNMDRAEAWSSSIFQNDFFKESVDYNHAAWILSVVAYLKDEELYNAFFTHFTLEAPAKGANLKTIYRLIRDAVVDALTEERQLHATHSLDEIITNFIQRLYSLDRLSDSYDPPILRMMRLLMNQNSATYPHLNTFTTLQEHQVPQALSTLRPYILSIQKKAMGQFLVELAQHYPSLKDNPDYSLLLSMWESRSGYYLTGPMATSEATILRIEDWRPEVSQRVHLRTCRVLFNNFE